MVLLNSLFADPEKILELNCSSTNDCVDFFDVEYPIDSDLIPAMYKMALDFVTASEKLGHTDQENDTEDAATPVRTQS